LSRRSFLHSSSTGRLPADRTARAWRIVGLDANPAR
jgi:hypothetical protein